MPNIDGVPIEVWKLSSLREHDMATATDLAVAESYFENLQNRGDIATADEIFDPDIQFHYPLGDFFGAVQVKNYIQAVRTAFPDLHFTTLDLISEGDRIAVRWAFAGSQTGVFRGKPGTGKKVQFPGVTIFHLTSGKIREMWVMFDPTQLI